VLRRIVAAIVLIPLAIIIVAFAVANRHDVTVSFDPFASNDPASSLTLPLFVLVILLVIIGVLIGGLATWLGQGKWRGAARRFERELLQLRGKIAAFEGKAGSNAPPADGTPERLRLRPPIR
jgi:uncharacterized integral membrane protein